MIENFRTYQYVCDWEIRWIRFHLLDVEGILYIIRRTTPWGRDKYRITLRQRMLLSDVPDASPWKSPLSWIEFSCPFHRALHCALHRRFWQDLYLSQWLHKSRRVVLEYLCRNTWRIEWHYSRPMVNRDDKTQTTPQKASTMSFRLADLSAINCARCRAMPSGVTLYHASLSIHTPSSYFENNRYRWCQYLIRYNK